MLIFIITTGLVIEILCVKIASLGDIMQNISKFSFLYITSFIAYIFAVFSIRRSITSNTDTHGYAFQTVETTKGGENSSKKIFWTILVFSLIFRLTLLPAIPSNDIFRYLWEGKLQLNWINPYSDPPASSNLEHFRDSFFSGITHKHLTTIYPPFTLMVFAIVDFISHSFISMKSAFLLFDVLSIFILIRFLRVMGKEPVNVLIYAWSPLVLISFAARGHCDSLQIFFITLALYFYSIQNKLTSILSIGLAVMSKFVSIIVAPFLILRNRLKYLAILFSVIILLYLPYISAGKGLFSTLFHFGNQYHYNDSVHFLILCLSLGSPFISKIITSVIFVAVLLYLYKRYLYKEYFKTGLHRDDNILRLAFWAIGTFLILAPTVHPWYLTWIVPFLCFYHSRAWLVLTGTVVFYYFMNHHLFSRLIEYNNEWVWQEVHWLKLPEYIPFYFLLIYEFLRKRLLINKCNHSALSKLAMSKQLERVTNEIP